MPGLDISAEPSLPTVNRLLAAFSFPLTLWATRLPGPPRAGGSLRPASGWGSVLGSGRPRQARAKRADSPFFSSGTGHFSRPSWWFPAQLPALVLLSMQAPGPVASRVLAA